MCGVVQVMIKSAKAKRGPPLGAPFSHLRTHDSRLYRGESVLFRIAFDELLVPHIG